MRKLSLLLAVIMLMTCVAIPSFAEEEAIKESEGGFYYVEANGDQAYLTAASKDLFIQADGLYFKDLNKNGALDAYEDYRLPVEDRVNDLMAQMTLDEKVGALFHHFAGGQFSPPYAPEDTLWITSEEPTYELGSQIYVPMVYQIKSDNITHFSYSSAGTPVQQQEAINLMQKMGEEARLGIPISFSTDRPYNTWGSMINMPYYAFGVAHDPELLYNMVAQYSKEMAAMGYTTIFHSYGVEIGSWYGDEVNNIATMITAETKAYEENGVNAMTKHYIARGGRSNFGGARSEARLWENWMVGWRAAVQDAKTSTIMMNNGTGFSDTPIIYDTETVGYLRNELGFDGVLCTDWPLYMSWPSATGFTNDGQDLSTFTAGQLYTRILEAGIDQFGGFRSVRGTDPEAAVGLGGMDLLSWPDVLIEAINDGTCSMELIDRSVFRIMRAKFNLGLFEVNQHAPAEILELACSEEYIANPFEITTVDDIIRARNDQMNAWEEELMIKSSILLKNDGLLPLTADAKVYVDSNNGDIKAADTAAIGAYATVVESLEEATVAVFHVTSFDESYELMIEDAEDAEVPAVVIIEATNTSGEPTENELATAAAFLMQTYQNTPDHGSSLGNFYRYVLPSLTADVLFGAKEPGGSTVFEIGRTADDKSLAWGDLQLDIGVDDYTRIYMAGMVKENPSVLLPNNLGDTLFTTNFGMNYSDAPAFRFDTLVLPSGMVDEEVESSGQISVQRNKATIAKAGEPFTLRFLAYNDGGDGTFNAEVYDNGELIASKFYSLDGGAWRVVSIELTLEAGEHTISVCGLEGTVKVAE